MKYQFPIGTTEREVSMSEFNTIEELLEELRAGHNIVLLDDENRENEGENSKGRSRIRRQAS